MCLLVQFKLYEVYALQTKQYFMLVRAQRKNEKVTREEIVGW